VAVVSERKVKKLIVTQMLYSLLLKEINMELNTMEVQLCLKSLAVETGWLQDAENVSKLQELQTSMGMMDIRLPWS